MNKFRLVSIAMLVFVVIFSGIIIAQNNDTVENSKQVIEQTSMQNCDKPCNPSECTPEQMEQYQNQCDQKMNCTPDEKHACDKASKDCSKKKSCTK